MDRKIPAADASTLVHLAKADAFAEAARCVAGLLVPPSVWREAVDEGEQIQAPDVPRIRAAANLRRVDLSDAESDVADAIAAEHRLGAGESEVLALGRRLGFAVIDEGRGARVARELGIVVVSTLFFPVLGRRAGNFEAEEAVALLQRLAIVTGARAEAVIALERRIRRT